MQRTMRYNVFVYAKISGKNLQINNQVGCNTIMDWKFKIKKMVSNCSNVKLIQ